MKTETKYIMAFCTSGLVAIAAYMHFLTWSVPCACEDKYRYSEADTLEDGGRPISVEDGCKLLQAFIGKDSVNRGVFVSKKVIDAIFCDSSYNGLHLYFAKESATVFNVMMEGGKDQHVRIKPGNSSDLWIAGTYCPRSCGTLREEYCAP